MHGRIRATKDVDIFVGTDTKNAHDVWQALRAFGAPLEDSSVADLTQPDTLFIIGRAPKKEAADRPQDRADLAYLREAHGLERP